MQSFERWGLRPQIPVPPAAEGFASRPPASGGWGYAPRPPKQPPHCEFLTTRLTTCMLEVMARGFYVMKNSLDFKAAFSVYMYFLQVN